MGANLVDGDRNGMSYMNLSSDDAVRSDDDVRAWTTTEIEKWLESISFSQYASRFKEHDISGETLLDLDYSLLAEMGISNIGDRVRLVMSIRRLRDQITSRETNGFLTSLKLLDDACISPFAVPSNGRSGEAHVRTVLPISSNHIATQSPSSAHTPNPPSSSMLLDDDRRNTIRFIFSEGRTKVVNIEGAGDSAEMIKRMGLAKIGVTDSPDNWIVFVYTSRGPKPVSDADLIEICRNSKRQERERLILCRQGRTPSTDEFMKSQQIQEAQAAFDDQVDQGDSVRSVHKSKLDKIVSEASSPSILRPSPKQSGSVIPRIKRLRNFFGQRPPSELISSNLTEYFPGHEPTVLEQTVRNSIRQSRQISLLGSGALNGRMSISSSRRQSTVGGAWLSATSEDQTLKLGESFYSSPVDASKEIQDLRKSVIANLTRRSVASMASAGARDAERIPPRSSRLTTGVDTPTLIQETQSESAENTLVGSITSSDVAKNLQNNSQEEQQDSKRSSPDEEQTSVKIESLQKTPTSKTDSSADNHSVITLESELSDEEFDILELQESVLQGPIKWIKGALIGQGTFGSVVLGMNALTGELMAVKQVEVPSAVIDDKRQAMIQVLEHEVSLLKYLQHDNIVQYLGSNSDGQYLNIFLEYVPGGSVATLLNTYGPFEEPLIRNFVRQILLGLQYLHDQGIIHRDIKGANVLVDNKGCIKISDFGISKKIEADLLTTPGSKRPSIQGSVFWMAPEVVKQTSYTLKADIWSLGCLVVEMFTGSHPFPEFSQMQAIFKIGSSCAPTIPEDITDEGKSFLTQTFEADYQRRPTAPELLAHPFMTPIVAGKTRE